MSISPLPQSVIGRPRKSSFSKSVNTTPRGSYLEALQPLSVTLGVQNVSFVAQTVDWIPEVMYDIVKAAFHHKGLSFVRIVQRCPEWLPKLFEPWLHDPQKILLLHHEQGGSGRKALDRRGPDPPACGRHAARG